MSGLALPALPHVLPESLARTKRDSATFVELVHVRYEWRTSPTERGRERYSWYVAGAGAGGAEQPGSK